MTGNRRTATTAVSKAASEGAVRAIPAEPSPIASAFARLRGGARRSVVPYITAGHPDLATTFEIVLALADAGATVVELGVPFSDPMADGPVIQRACEAALRNGTRLEDVLSLTRELQKKTDVPIVLFSYLNPLLQHGLEKLAREARQNGIAGVLVTDLPTDAGASFAQALRDNGADSISLVAPTSTDERLRQTAAAASGFIYAVSRTGVTGTRERVSDDARTLVERVRRFTTLPIALGFGISKPEHAKEAWQFADAVVVGSALVRLIDESGRDAAARCGEFLRGFTAE
jgi:tryptophan synthase alpha chain